MRRIKTHRCLSEYVSISIILIEYNMDIQMLNSSYLTYFLLFGIDKKSFYRLCKYVLTQFSSHYSGSCEAFNLICNRDAGGVIRSDECFARVT